MAGAFDWIAPFVTVTGIVGWVSDALPDVVAITLIVVGALGSAAMRKFVPSATEPTGPQ